ncbi:MAG TPA: hypothetical protein VM680_18200 [Verrucomicrobiae bacterium]|nr:hypothetical protein [Verrucomicrobiae bacterium]
MPPRESMGSVAAMLLPIDKLKKPSPRGVPFEREIHEFLSTNLNGYTVASGNISGYWKDNHGHEIYGEHREYRVALPPSQTARQTLEIFLGTLAHEMGEACIYLECGGEAFLIYASHQ